MSAADLLVAGREPRPRVLPGRFLGSELRIIFGSGDRIIKPARHIEWLRRVHGNPTVRGLEGVGHLPHHSVPGIALEALQELVSCQAIADPAPQHPRAVA